uniref:integrase core domain-containing protein n=1 Tax=Cereibacter sphaeroides TaxID=1063 RepID=UPI0018D4E9BC
MSRRCAAALSGRAAGARRACACRSRSKRSRSGERRAIGDWIAFYNHRRPHQALDMRTPAEAFASAA